MISNSPLRVLEQVQLWPVVLVLRVLLLGLAVALSVYCFDKYS